MKEFYFEGKKEGRLKVDIFDIFQFFWVKKKVRGFFWAFYKFFLFFFYFFEFLDILDLFGFFWIFLGFLGFF